MEHARQSRLVERKDGLGGGRDAALGACVRTKRPEPPFSGMLTCTLNLFPTRQPRRRASPHTAPRAITHKSNLTHTQIKSHKPNLNLNEIRTGDSWPRAVAKAAGADAPALPRRRAPPGRPPPFGLYLASQILVEPFSIFPEIRYFLYTNLQI